MSEKLSMRLLWLTALLIAAVGVGMTVRSYRLIDEAETRFERKIREYGELRNLGARMAVYKSAEAAFDGLGGAELVPFKGLLQKRFPASRPDDVRQTRREAVPGWLVHDVEAALNDVVLSEVMAFAAEVEKRRPPWVLQKCVLTASSRIEKKGNAVMTFAGISR